jgi:molybdopterin-guanine dinucleotide biosynthesis adapter protein
MSGLRTPAGAPVIGIAGWKNSGKTTLMERLIGEFSRRGFRVASVKHAHHAFQIDDGATDSARHRRAGAAQVAIVSATRWALVTELGGAPEPKLEEILAQLAPCDLVLVEGYKRAPICKIEARRAGGAANGDLAARDELVIAIAADRPAEQQASIPIFDLDDSVGIVGWLVEKLRIVRLGPI